MTTAAISHCLNCSTDLHGMAYCGNCGQRNIHRRLVWRSLLDDLNVHILELNLPWMRTIKDLTIRPGKVCSDYADGHRVVYVNPIKYMFYILAVLVIFFGLNEHLDPRQLRFGVVPQSFYDTYPPSISYIFTNIPLYVLLMSPVAILIFRIIFWRSVRNWVEITCFVYYMIGHCALILTVIMGLDRAISHLFVPGTSRFADVVVMITTMLSLWVIPFYVTFAAMNFFKSRLDWSFIGALTAVLIFILACIGVQARFMLLYLPIVNAYSLFQ